MDETPPVRIHSIDLLRGIMLLVILINHIELYPSGYDIFTGRGRLFVSAAEGFFFLSGLLVGMVYKRRLNRGMGYVFKRMWSRAAQLYLLGVALTLTFTYWAIQSNHQNIKYGLTQSTHWHQIIADSFLMKYNFGWADFLPHYAVFMFFAPFAFYALSKNKWWLLSIASIVIWFFRGTNFGFAWQIIFVMGMVVGYHWQGIQSWLIARSEPQKKWLQRSVLSITVVTFTLSYAIVFLLSQLNQHLPSEPPNLQHFTWQWNGFNAYIWRYFEKWTMEPGRIILFALWFSVLYSFINRYRIGINRRTRGIVELVGRNSLFVYILHSFIVFVFKLYIPAQTTLWQNFLITTAALIALIIITLGYKSTEDKLHKRYGLKLHQLALAKSKQFIFDAH